MDILFEFQFQRLQSAVKSKRCNETGIAVFIFLHNILEIRRKGLEIKLRGRSQGENKYVKQSIDYDQYS